MGPQACLRCLRLFSCLAYSCLHFWGCFSFFGVSSILGVCLHFWGCPPFNFNHHFLGFFSILGSSSIWVLLMSGFVFQFWIILDFEVVLIFSWRSVHRCAHKSCKHAHSWWNVRTRVYDLYARIYALIFMKFFSVISYCLINPIHGGGVSIWHDVFRYFLHF